MITLGNHTYRHRDVYPYLDSEQRIVRPANFPASNPGRGHTIVEAAGMRVAVINLSGQMHLQVERNPFPAIDELLDSLAGAADAIVVDFHAELTSEKVAMGWHLDGRVAAVLGTHTHVPTADARVLPGGTAHIADVGHDRLARRRDRRQARAGATRPSRPRCRSASTPRTRTSG